MGQKTRKAALLKVALSYGVEPDPQGSVSSQEDLADALTEPIQRYLVVTNHGEFHYAHRTFSTQGEAKTAATEYVEDDIFPETPVEIVDLDTGQRFTPKWDALPWAARKLATAE